MVNRMAERPTPREIALSINSASKKQYTVVHEFVKAGWKVRGDCAIKDMAYNVVKAYPADGGFRLVFPTGQHITFDAAEEAIRYVSEVEQHLAHAGA